MELAGVFGMGTSQEGLRPDLLKYVFLKDQGASEQQSGTTVFRVFNQAHDVVVPGTASAESHGQHVAAVENDTAPEASAVKQTAITDFFSPRLVSSEVQSGCVVGGHVFDPTWRRFATPPFITPCSSVRLAEVPAVFQVQSECVVEDHLDPTRPLFEREVLKKPAADTSSVETDSSPAQVGLNTPSSKFEDAATKKAIDFLKLSRRYSVPSRVTNWHSHSVSDSSNDMTLVGSPAQVSDSSSPTSPTSGKEEVPSNNSSPPTLPTPELTGTSEQDAEKYWIEKDEERLAVIANMEKTIAEVKGELANTVAAFQMASGANNKLQAKLDKNITSLSEMEEDRNHLFHSLDAADMDKEKLKKELAHSRRDRKYQFDRAEEALTLIEADPSKEIFAGLLQAKAEAESRNISQQSEMESEMDYLKSQLKERCDSVARLTVSLSRVSDSDGWKEIQKEMLDLNIRAKNLPHELQGAWLECEKWKGQHATLWKKHENLLLEQASLEEKYQKVMKLDLRAMRELKRDLKNKAANSERALKGCLKQVFERMVRCSLYLEAEGFLPFDEEHRAIGEQVLKLTGKDYEEALNNYYTEHDIRDEFKLSEDDEDEDKDDDDDDDDDDDEDEDADEDDDEDDDEDKGGHDLNNGGPAGKEEPGSPGDDQEHDEGHTGNHCNTDPHTSTLAAGPANTAHESSSAPTPVMMEHDNTVAAAANEEEVLESPETQEAVQTLDGLSPGGSAEEARDSHLPIKEGPVQAPKVNEAAIHSTNEGGVRDESFEDGRGIGVDHDRCEDRAVLHEDDSEASYSTDELVEGDDDSFRKASDDAVPEDMEKIVNDETMAHQRNATSPPAPTGGNSPSVRTFLKPRVKKQTFSGSESPVSTLAANTEPGSSEEFTFSKPVFTSKPAEATSLSTPAGGNGPDVGRPFAFGFGKSSPNSLFAAPTADPKAKSGEESMSTEPLKVSEAGATNLLTAAKGNSQDIWKGISFATDENKPFSFVATPAADLEAKSNEKAPFSTSFSTSQPAEAKAPVFELSEAERGSEATKAQKEAAPATTEKAAFPSQHQGFNFGGNSSPASFTGSSPSFLAQSIQPASTGMFSFSGQNPALATSDTKEMAAEGGVVKDESPKDDVLEMETSKKEVSKEEALEEALEKAHEKKPEEGTPNEEVPKVDEPEGDSPQEKEQKKKMQKEEASKKEESAPKEQAPKEGRTPKEAPAPAPSEPSRNQKRAAKKQQKKAAKKAENKAKNANAQASRRVQQALMMR